MTDAQTVVVYNFRVHDGGEQLGSIAAFKAPRGLIRERFLGQVLEGTGEEVEAGALDAEGRYRRIATGWGELAD